MRSMFSCTSAFAYTVSWTIQSDWAHLRKSGARTIMCRKSSSDRRPSLSRSASSITFSHTILTSSSVSSFRVSLFKVFSRSDLQMKSSLLKSCPLKGEKRRYLKEICSKIVKHWVFSLITLQWYIISSPRHVLHMFWMFSDSFPPSSHWRYENWYFISATMSLAHHVITYVFTACHRPVFLPCRSE